MNRKQLGILLVLVVVLGGAGLIIFNKQKEGRSAGNTGIGQKVIGDFAINDVTHIRISEGTNELNLVRKEDTWRVAERNDYPANFAQLTEFVLKVRDLKAVQTEQVGPSQLARLNLNPGSGTNAATLVEFKAGDKTLATLLLGKMHMSARRGANPFGGMEGGSWPDGRYVAVGPNPTSVALVSETFDQVEPSAEQWLNKDFVRVGTPKSIAVTLPGGTNSWKLVREMENADWKLADAKEGEELDTSKAASVTHTFSSPSFNDVLPGDQAAASAGAKPAEVTIETFDGFTYALKIGEQTNNAYPVVVSVNADLAAARESKPDEKAEDKERLDKEFNEKRQRLADLLKQEQAYGKWTYLVSTWSVEPLLKPRSELLVKADESKENEDSAADSNDAPEVENPALPPTRSQPAVE